MVSENGQLQQQQHIIRINQDGQLSHQSPKQMVMLVQGDSSSSSAESSVVRRGVTFSTVRVRKSLYCGPFSFTVVQFVNSNLCDSSLEVDCVVEVVSELVEDEVEDYHYEVEEEV